MWNYVWHLEFNNCSDCFFVSVEKITFILTKCYLFRFSSNKSYLWPESFCCSLWFTDQPWKNKCGNSGDSVLVILSRRLWSLKESETGWQPPQRFCSPVPSSSQMRKFSSERWSEFCKVILLVRDFEHIAVFWLWVPIPSHRASTHAYLKSLPALSGREIQLAAWFCT